MDAYKHPSIRSSKWSDFPINFRSLTPLDGRNYHKISPLSDYFSEFAQNRQRVFVEISYVVFLSHQGIAPKITKAQEKRLLQIFEQFSLEDMQQIKEHETKTNHDVKAVELFLVEKFNSSNLKTLQEFIHWSLTSEDINNLSYSLNLQAYRLKELHPLLQTCCENLIQLIEVSDYPLLGRTHGLPANVTTMAKELAVFLDRIINAWKQLSLVKLQGKCNGAVGSFADQSAIYQEIDWLTLSYEFVSSLGLDPALATTQILPYDSYICLFDALAQMQDIAIDLCQNVWHYISFDYFKPKAVGKEVGSSTMPQKVNPLYLEGAEGGFEIANSLFAFYKKKLSKSRLQRDLSDSTVRRSFGIAFAYSHLSWQSLSEAMYRLIPNPTSLATDLENHYEVLSSAVQNYLRTKGYEHSYDQVFALVRGKQLSKKEYEACIDELQITKEDNAYLKSFSFISLAKPSHHISSQIVDKAKRFINEIAIQRS